MPGHRWSPGMGLHGFDVNNKPSIGDDHHSEDAFKFRRGQYFWHTRAAIGHGAAVAVAQRARVAGHTLRRPRAPPNARDALLFPATVPSGI